GQDAILGIDKRAPAERNDGLRSGGRQFFQTETLEVSEMRLTFLTKDFGDCTVFTALDLFVEIDELPTESLGEAPAHRALAGAHEPDEVNTTMCHSQSLYWRSG